MEKHRPKKDVIAINNKFMPMQFLRKTHAIKAIASGRAFKLDPITFEQSRSFNEVRIIVYPHINTTFVPRIPKQGYQKGILIRDNNTCAYCGKFANTVDHIVPRAHGGITEWSNLIASCFPCNQKKRNRTPKEANMKLLFSPKTIQTFLLDKFYRIVKNEGQFIDLGVNPF